MGMGLRRRVDGRGGGNVFSVAFFLLQVAITVASPSAISQNNRLDDEALGFSDLVWVVQLSDIHVSVHHPDRAQDFIDIVGPTLGFIKPSLVLLTGDLTDGKSLDMYTMKQDEREWVEYWTVIQNVVQSSGLKLSSFYDVRGNHDNFGVPVINGSFDFFSRYSISGKLQRNRRVNSVTIETSKRKLLFVGFDSTMSCGVRGPTNLFGHPNDEILAEIESELSQVDSDDIPVTKVSFGHFPLSFSTASESGKSLKDVFINQSLNAYLCGHLHTKFGKNLKRYHHSRNPSLYSNQLFQLNGHRVSSKNGSYCLNSETKAEGFWEWEMGDWRKSRAMRILAIDNGHISFVDINFKFGSERIIILPTFPLDSRFSSSNSYKCNISEPFSTKTIRALVFSASPIISVLAKIYDSSSGIHILVMEERMQKLASSHGSLFVTPFNVEKFEDPSPERYLLEILATDVNGNSVASELRPFTVTDIPAKFHWSLKEFLMMGCQWDSLYYAVFWSFYIIFLSILLIPRLLITYRSSVNQFFRLSMELCNIRAAWFGIIIYVFYLVLCPWFCGKTFSVGEERLYMVYKGWISGFDDTKKVQFIGSPDVMIIVLPHIYLVVFPAFLTMMGLAAENARFGFYLNSVSSKKKNDDVTLDECSRKTRIRWLRKVLLVVFVAICWKHYRRCVGLMKAYDMNPVVHFPVYCFGIPVLLVYVIWRTGRCDNVLK